MQKAKIAIARQRYNPFGGAERFVEGALSALSRSGEVEVTLLSRSWDGSAATASNRRVEIVNPAYSRLPFGRVNRNRSFAEGAAHKTLLQVFELLGTEHPLVTLYRRRLYQALY